MTSASVTGSARNGYWTISPVADAKRNAAIASRLPAAPWPSWRRNANSSTAASTRPPADTRWKPATTSPGQSETIHGVSAR